MSNAQRRCPALTLVRQRRTRTWRQPTVSRTSELSVWQPAYDQNMTGSSCGQLLTCGASLMMIDDDDAAMDASSKGAVDQRLQSMCIFIIRVVAERFGTKQTTKNNSAKPNHLETKITQLRKEL